MGMPRGYVDPAGEEGQWYKTRAVRNSLVGNSYHVPSVMMFMCVLLMFVMAVTTVARSGPIENIIPAKHPNS